MADTGTPLNLVSLCAGVGMLDEGASAGLEHLGFAPRVVAYVERESYAASVLLARMADASLEPTPVWCGDLGRFDCGPFAGRVDGLVAGFPCQPWSVAGAKLGHDDARWIFPAIMDLARKLGVWLLVLENVPGLVSGGGLGTVLGSLAEGGFDAEWLHLAAAAVEAGHKRERVFIVAVMRDFQHTLGDAGLQHVDPQQRSHGTEHSRAGESVDAECAGPLRAESAGDGGAQEGGGSRRPQSDGRCRELADAECSGLRERGRTEAVESRERSDRSLRERDMATATARDYRGGGAGSDASGRQEPDGHAGLGERELFAPRPGDVRWSSIVGRNPHLAPAIEPGLCVLADGLAMVVDEGRADQLRCAGNGVVALQAAVATVVLGRRLMK